MNVLPSTLVYDSSPPQFPVPTLLALPYHSYSPAPSFFPHSNSSLSDTFTFIYLLLSCSSPLPQIRLHLSFILSPLQVLLPCSFYFHKRQLHFQGQVFGNFFLLKCFLMITKGKNNTKKKNITNINVKKYKNVPTDTDGKWKIWTIIGQYPDKDN
jgi:hypothetical protein